MASPACCGSASCETCCRRHAWGPMPLSTCWGDATAARPTPPRPSRRRCALPRCRKHASRRSTQRGSLVARRCRRRRCLVGCRPTCSSARLSTAQALARMLLHFHSIPWMTYRTGFTPIAVGDVQLRSDAGWGCTLRRWAAGPRALLQQCGVSRLLASKDQACCAACCHSLPG